MLKTTKNTQGESPQLETEDALAVGAKDLEDRGWYGAPYHMSFDAGQGFVISLTHVAVKEYGQQWIDYIEGHENPYADLVSSISTMVSYSL